MNPSLYQKNIQRLAEKYPKAARIIDDSKPVNRYSAVTNEDHPPTISVKTSENEEIFLHSKYDPAKEAVKLVDSFQVSPTINLVVSGFGCGYHILELIRRVNDRDCFLIAEPNPSVIKLAFHLLDFSTLLGRNEILWLLGQDPQTIQPELSHVAFSLLANGITVVLHPPSVQIDPDYHNRVQETISNFYMYAKVNINTQVEKQDTFVGNAFSNLLEFVHARPVSDLFGIAERMPVFVVAAGPSLDKNVYRLKEVRDQGYIVAVDSAAKTLLDHGIRPDFIVSIDFTQHAEKYFQDIETSDLSLVFDLEIYPEIPRNFKGKKYAIHLPKKSVPEFVARVIENRGSIEKGLSVSHSAVLLAKEMGASEIILVGQDLGFPKSQWHTKGSNFFQNLEISEKNELSLCKAEDIFGGQIESSAPMLVFKNHFEVLMNHLKIDCYDATEGGVRIRGTKLISLDEAIIRFAQGNAGSKINLSTQNDDFAQDLGILREVFQKALLRLEHFNHRAYEGAQALVEAEQKFRTTKERHFLLETFGRIKKIGEELDRDPELLALLKDSSTEALIIRVKKTGSSILDLSQASDQDIYARIRKEGIFFGVLVRASDFLAKQIADFLNRTKNSSEIKSEVMVG